LVWGVVIPAFSGLLDYTACGIMGRCPMLMYVALSGPANNFRYKLFAIYFNNSFLGKVNLPSSKYFILTTKYYPHGI
jgi:hypothetical protein